MGFTRSNPDICGDSTYCPPDTPSITDPASTCKLSASACKTPRFSTRQKIRWDSEFLYIGAELEEPQVWANNTEHQSVIFSDNDYEIFISPDGTNHYYKEYEMNARGVWSAESHSLMALHVLLSRPPDPPSAAPSSAELAGLLLLEYQLARLSGACVGCAGGTWS